MCETYEKLLACDRSVREKTDFNPRIALVLGSGLGSFADRIQVESALDYQDIEGFPVSTVPGHRGRFIFGYVKDVPVVAMQGRVHYYEGYSMADVVLPIRLMGMLGARILLLTNASGGIQEGMHAGDFMLITDQISSFVPSPLAGANPDKLGVRFPDMSHIYCKELQDAVRRAAKRLEIPLKEGVYIQLAGPNYESPAEIRMCRILGADAVGMSTACEAVAAAHMGLRVCGISCVSNLAAGLSGKPLSHTEVQEAADRAAPLFQELLIESIFRVNREFHGLLT